jgi:nucleoside-diphosphate-sugar epimerase
MKIAITGATGFVGQAVLEEIEQGMDIARALTRRDQERRRGVMWVPGSLDDLASLKELVGGSQAVIHIAGLTNTPNPAEFHTANVEGTERLIAACKSAGVERLVFVSSLSAREPKLSAYGASKFEAEERVKESGLDWTIVRPPAVYGPHDNDMFELFRAAEYGVVPLPPRGATSIIHVKDLARLLVALCDAGASTRHKTYEPDDGREGGWSHKELGEAIGRAVGRQSTYAINLPAEVLRLAASVDKWIRKDKAKLTADRVGYMLHPNWVVRSSQAVPKEIWEPQIDAELGLKQTALWYEAEGWL